jgi:hypothetical protein
VYNWQTDVLVCHVWTGLPHVEERKWRRDIIMDNGMGYG